MAIALPPATIEEADNSLGKLLTLIGVRDDMPPGATDTLVAAQGLNGEVAEGVEKHII